MTEDDGEDIERAIFDFFCENPIVFVPYHIRTTYTLIPTPMIIDSTLTSMLYSFIY